MGGGVSQPANQLDDACSKIGQVRALLEPHAEASPELRQALELLDDVTVQPPEAVVTAIFKEGDEHGFRRACREFGVPDTGRHRKTSSGGSRWPSYLQPVPVVAGVAGVSWALIRRCGKVMPHPAMTALAATMVAGTATAGGAMVLAPSTAPTPATAVVQPTSTRQHIDSWLAAEPKGRHARKTYHPAASASARPSVSATTASPAATPVTTPADGPQAGNGTPPATTHPTPSGTSSPRSATSVPGGSGQSPGKNSGGTLPSASQPGGSRPAGSGGASSTPNDQGSAAPSGQSNGLLQGLVGDVGDIARALGENL